MHTQQGIVRLLRQSDAQLFAGWGAHPSISDGKILERIDHIADKAAMLLNVSHTLALFPSHSQYGNEDDLTRQCTHWQAVRWLCTEDLLHHLILQENHLHGANNVSEDHVNCNDVAIGPAMLTQCSHHQTQ